MVLNILAGIVVLVYSGVTSGSSLIVGENVHLARLDQTSEHQVGSFARLAADSGANSIRIDVDWSELQPISASEYDAQYAARLNSVFREANANGLKVIVTMLSSPCWGAMAPPTLLAGCTAADDTAGQYAPSDDTSYAAAAAWLVRRYGSDLAAFEVWNEPDNQASTSDFLSPEPAAAYAALLAATYKELHPISPVPILGASLMSADTGFMAQLLADGVGHDLDGVAVHLYAIEQTTPTWTSSAESDTPDLAALRNLHAQLLNAGVKAPIWITEIGMQVCGPASNQNCVSAADASIGLPAAISYLAKQSWIRAIELYELVTDNGASPTGPSFALYQRNGQPRLSTDTVLSALTGARDSR